MKSNLDSMSVPFPFRLMSSDKTATNMTQDFARDIRNMYIQQNGAGVKRNGFTKAFFDMAGGETILQMMSYIPPAGGAQTIAFFADGSLRLVNAALNQWDTLYTGLSTVGKMRYVHFAGKLVMFNGVDDVLSYDGMVVAPVRQWVTETGANLTYVSANTIRVDSSVEFYTIGEKVKLELSSGFVESTVVALSQSGDTTTITLAGAVADNTLSGLEVHKKPPRFSYMHAAHDRLWGFGSGAITADGFENPEGRGTVYYTDGFSDESSWYNESGVLQFINMADKLPRSDALVAMGEKDGFTVFFFRNHIQLWSGYDPSVNGDMQWVKTLPVGAVHGDLIVHLQNDLMFFTQSGVRSLSRVIQTEQLDIADIGAEMDTDLTRAINGLLADDATYRKAHSFNMPEQGWFGFSLGGVAYIFQTSAKGMGWALYDGIFEDADASLTTEKGVLYIAKGGQAYLYDTSSYSDNGAPIAISWWTPWLKRSSGGSRWANKYVSMVSDQTEAMNVAVKRFKDYNNTSYVASTLPLPKPEDYWDVATWGDAWFDHGVNTPTLARDKFVADVYSFAFEQSSTAGPLTIYGFKLYGVQEKW